MDEKETRGHLLTLLANLAQARAEWSQSDEKKFSAKLAQAIEESIDAFGEGMIPSDFRDLERRCYAMEKEYKRAKDQAGGTWETGNLPGNGFWAALEHVLDGRELLLKPRAKRVESVALLTAQKVSDNQICKIYGWVDPDGSPQLHKVDEERAQPGTHTSEWVNPHDRHREELSKREAASLAALREKQGIKLKALGQPAEETVEHQ